MRLARSLDIDSLGVEQLSEISGEDMAAAIDVGARTNEHKRVIDGGISAHHQGAGQRLALPAAPCRARDRAPRHPHVRRSAAVLQPRGHRGIIIAVLICLGAALLAYFKPLGKRGGESLLVDRTTNQLYVVLPGQRSAATRLQPDIGATDPRQRGHSGGGEVRQSSTACPRVSRSASPGAPYATPVSAAPESQWTLCDTVIKPESVAPTVETSVIVHAAGDGLLGRADAPRPGHAGLVQEPGLAGHRRPAGTPSTCPTGPSPRRSASPSPPRRRRSRRACSTRCPTRDRGGCPTSRSRVRRTRSGCRRIW